MKVKVPKLIKRLYPGFVWHFPREENSVYLTFDDGPRPEVTPWVLDQLDKYQAKATFFCIGKNVELFPELFDEIKRRGHAVGNHSLRHDKVKPAQASVCQNNADPGEGAVGALQDCHVVYNKQGL